MSTCGPVFAGLNLPVLPTLPSHLAKSVPDGELLFLGGPLQRDGRAAATVNDLRDLVEVADAHELLMLDGLVAVALEGKLARLQVGKIGRASCRERV